MKIKNCLHRTIRDRIKLMKRETPRRETLPNARTLTVRYKRITRVHLPANIRLRQPYKQREVP